MSKPTRLLPPNHPCLTPRVPQVHPMLLCWSTKTAWRQPKLLPMTPRFVDASSSKTGVSCQLEILESQAAESRASFSCVLSDFLPVQTGVFLESVLRTSSLLDVSARLPLPTSYRPNSVRGSPSTPKPDRRSICITTTLLGGSAGSGWASGAFENVHIAPDINLMIVCW
jgi:hypothetical protein